MKISILLFFLFIFFGCKNSRDFKSDFTKHKFDAAVINNLPLYDTIRQLVSNNYDSFHLSETKWSFTYIYNFDTTTHISGHSNLDVPSIIYPQIVRLFNRIGKSNIFGFTVSKDNTFEILIRNTHLTEYFLDVRERLYYYPNPSRIHKTEFPMKDTLLTNKWQYRIWYDKRSGF